jgi:hypothetical protein
VNVSSDLLEKSNKGTKRENNRERKDKNKKRQKRRNEHIWAKSCKTGHTPLLFLFNSLEEHFF